MSAITEKLSSMKSFKARTPATNEQIKIAEINLGLSFAKEYKEYLAKFGCASVYGHEFTGLCKSSRLNVVNVTVEQRRLNTNIPFSWYVIEQANIDDIVIWQNESGEVYMTSPNCPAIKVAENLLEYITK